MLQYALLAATLPGGHLFQVKIDGVTGYAELTAPTGVDPDAVQRVRRIPTSTRREGREHRRARAEAAEAEDAAAEGHDGDGAERQRRRGLPRRTRATCSPSAATSRCCRPGTREPNAPTQDYFHSQIYFDPTQKGAKAAAVALKKLVEPADVKPLPKDPALRALDPGAMLLVVVGQTFHDRSAATPAVETPEAAAGRTSAPTRARAGELARAVPRRRCPFKLMVPTSLERSSVPDTVYGDKPVRLY